MRGAVLICGLVVAAVAAGCGGDGGGGGDVTAGNASATFVGTVDGSDAYIAILTNGERVAGYVCDGKEVSSWFGDVPLEDGKAKLVGRDGAPLGSVSIAEDGASGEVDVAGAPHAFSAERAEGAAGLSWEVERDAGEFVAETGWIVLGDGSFRGIRSSAVGGLSAAPPPPPQPTFGPALNPWTDPDPEPWTDPDPTPTR